MKLTLSVIKTDIGSISAHICLSQRLLESVYRHHAVGKKHFLLVLLFMCTISVPILHLMGTRDSTAQTVDIVAASARLDLHLR